MTDETNLKGLVKAFDEKYAVDLAEDALLFIAKFIQTESLKAIRVFVNNRPSLMICHSKIEGSSERIAPLYVAITDNMDIKVATGEKVITTQIVYEKNVSN